MSKSKGIGQVSEPALYHVPIKSWPIDERPREKLIRRGAANLSDIELIAILIRTGKKGVTAIDLARSLFSGNKTFRFVK